MLGPALAAVKRFWAPASGGAASTGRPLPPAVRRRAAVSAHRDFHTKFSEKDRRRLAPATAVAAPRGPGARHCVLQFP